MTETTDETLFHHELHHSERCYTLTSISPSGVRKIRSMGAQSDVIKDAKTMISDAKYKRHRFVKLEVTNQKGDVVWQWTKPTEPASS